MSSTMQIEQLTQKLSQTRKYQRLDQEVIYQAVSRASTLSQNHYEIDRKARNILHQVWSSSYSKAPNFVKHSKILAQALQSAHTPKDCLVPILSQHSSTRERLAIADDFYAQIFKITGIPESIVDHACGLNPLMFPWMSFTLDTKYYAYDIDQKGLQFLSDSTNLLSRQGLITPQFHFAQRNVLSSVQQPAQVALFLKCLSTFEHLQPGLWLQILERQQAQYKVISFALKSLKHYQKYAVRAFSGYFESYLVRASLPYQKITFSNELVYILKPPS
ncbi:MAG: 16S rRNA methyltransferase [Patescibacteria group bacterium]|nr:MAG: 16S rRNA methyltransferase [Patescibacteria group bacterium]